MIAFLVLRVDVLFVQLLLGSEETGYYAVAVGLADNVYLLPVVVATLLFPRLSATNDEGRRVETGENRNSSRRIRHGHRRTARGLLAEPVIQYFWTAFLPAGAGLSVAFPGIVFLSVNTPFMNYFAAIGIASCRIVGPRLDWSSTLHSTYG